MPTAERDLPQTEAGRRLLEPRPREDVPNRAAYHPENCGVWGLRPCDCGLAPIVVAIEQEAVEKVWPEYVHDKEAEARADLAVRIVAAVEGLYVGPNPGYSREPDRDEVLRAIREASDDRRA